MEMAGNKISASHRDERIHDLPAPSSAASWKLWKRFKRVKCDIEEVYTSKHDSWSELECDAVQRLLTAVSGEETNEDATLQQKAYINFIKKKICKWPQSYFDEILEDEFDPGMSGANGVLTLIAEIADCTKKGYNFSIDQAIDQCIESRILAKSVKDPPGRDKARIAVYNCVSWISMLYPSLDIASPPPTSFDISSAQCAGLMNRSQPLSKASLPICEVVQEFGPLLPVKRDTSSEGPRVMGTVFSQESLYVSQLNAKNLQQIGGIEIVWIDYLCSHLIFDNDEMRLFVYRLPSFCYLNRSQNSAFGRIVDQYYDDFNKPPGFTSVAFMKEVLRSYRLIFADDSRARSLYTRKEQKRALKTGSRDPYLDNLCTGRASERGIVRSSYNKTTDFPILGDRLSILQDFVQRQTPNTVTLLWCDRRNLLQWYTFWAVAIIGVIGILFAIIQTALAAGQVYYAARSKSK